MSRKPIEENVKRRLFAESMGRCMNPNCRKELFFADGDIIEKAHIDAYCETEDNSFDNLVLLCPNCHTNFDKNHAFSPEEVREWKKIRQDEIDKFFSKTYSTFEELQNEIKPILIENKYIYENYYVSNQKDLWEKFESKILINNRKIKNLLNNNMGLIQGNGADCQSNQFYITQLLIHIDEFEQTRENNSKIRHVLFPEKVNSIFGVEPVFESIIPMTEALERLITILDCPKIALEAEHPYIIIEQNDRQEKIMLEDAPRLRQLYYSYECFIKTGVRLNSLCFALKYISKQGGRFKFRYKNNLREIVFNGKNMLFVYKYCLSRNDLEQLAPEEGLVIVNLHNWNGESCISREAYETANSMNVQLLTIENYYTYVRENAKSRRFD